MRRLMFVATLSILGTALAQAALAEGATTQYSVVYAAESRVAENIKKECPLEKQLSDFIKTYATELGLDVAPLAAGANTKKGSVLVVEIVDAVSSGNAFIGHRKFTGITGKLYQDGKETAAFHGSRNSMGGAFGGYKGSCAVLGRTVQALGRDVAGWLKAPTNGAALGDG